MKRKLSLLFAGLLCLSLCLGAEAAGTVTDTLTVIKLQILSTK